MITLISPLQLDEKGEVVHLVLWCCPEGLVGANALVSNVEQLVATVTKQVGSDDVEARV